MKELTRESYGDRIHLLEEGILRFRKTPGMEGAVSAYAEGIGNLYAEFEPALAEEWFRMSLEWLDKVFDHPTVRSALLFWKLGDRNAFLDHSTEAAKRSFAALTNEEWLSSARKHDIAAQRMFAAMASFLSGEYRTAERSSTQFLAEGAEANGPHIIHAIRQLAKGVQMKDREAFEAGLSILRKHIDEWPTSNSSDCVDLYRYALWLRDTELSE